MNLLEWLNRIQSLHVRDMDLSLERVKEVAKRLNILAPSVVTVGGTNGKGSCVAGLEAIYRAAGYRVGAFTSPILFRHNEYVRIQGMDVSDEQLCAAFARIELARKTITLTPFEFTALAAFDIFQHSNLDIWILEVGLGGRFDAVNVIDADIAIVASIGIDHVEWLGDTREKIAYEKAGIFRPGKPAICGDINPPQTLIDYAKEIGSSLFCQQVHFNFEKKSMGWTWLSEKLRLENLPYPTLALPNMSCVLMAVELLQAKHQVEREAIVAGLQKVALPGRIQVIAGEVLRIFDVSHNPAAAEFLAQWLRDNPHNGKTRAVFSMLSDKDILSTINVMRDLVDLWYIAGLSVKRGAMLRELEEAFTQANLTNKKSFFSIEEAYDSAMKSSKVGDRVIVFGSFHTVASIIKERI